MAYNISDEPYEKHGGEDSGGDSLDFTPQHRHVASVDNPAGGAGEKHADDLEETTSTNTASAKKGAAWAVQGGSLKGDSMPFNESNGCFTSGDMVGDKFEQAIRDSGGVHQGSTWVSDPAPGVRRTLVEHTVTLDTLRKQDAGSGRTFETQRRSHWSHDKWGG